MAANVTHLDVGITMGVAHVLGVKPTIDILCGSTDGGYIHDDYLCIQTDGKIAAACNCSDCAAIAEIMHRYDLKPEPARRKYQRSKGKADNAD